MSMDIASVVASSHSLAASTASTAATALATTATAPLRSSLPLREVKERKFQNDFKSSSLAMAKKDKRISLDVRSSNPRKNPFSHGEALIDTVLREGSKPSQRDRTYSCDRGMELMVKKFYEQKLIKAKKTADRDLANFIAATEHDDNRSKGEDLLVHKLKDIAAAIRDADADSLQAGKLRDGVRTAWECMWRAMNLEESSEAGTAVAAAINGGADQKSNPHSTRIKMLSTKLLWILSKVKHRSDYLEADYSEEFVQWAAEVFKRKNERKQTRRAMKKDLEVSINPIAEAKQEVEIIEDTLAGKYMVCRICEGVLSEEKLAEHSRLCSEVAVNHRLCENCDDNIRILATKFSSSLQDLVQMEAVSSPTNESRAPDRRRKCVSTSIRSTLATVMDLTQRISQINIVAEGSAETIRIYQVQIERLASVLEKNHKDHPAAGLLNALAASVSEKCNTVQAVQSIIARIESSDHSAIGSRFGAKPQERISTDNSTTSTVAASSTVRPSIRDFDIIKPISRGSFGSVLLARKKATGDVYAIKVVKKQSLIEKNQMDFIANERNILAFTDNPFVVKLYYSFQSANNLYMVMEYLPGGDCFSLLRNLTVFPENMARFYVAELVHALGYLHSNGIIHRDLKPDNLLIGVDGHLKLTDFGLSKMGLMDRQDEVYEWKNVGGMVAAENKDQDTSCVGTPDYLAPEIFLSSGHGPEVDWWAVGCITYEFLVGITPFYADTCEDIFASIMSNSIIWPDGDDELSPEAIDFISKLLAIDPSVRLGAKGAEEVKSHPWFAGVDWTNLRHSTSPFVPKLDKFEDTFYFEARNAIYQTTWEGDPDVGTQGEEDPAARLRNFSMVNIPHLLSLNQTLVTHHESPPASPSQHRGLAESADNRGGTGSSPKQRPRA